MSNGDHNSGGKRAVPRHRTQSRVSADRQERSIERLTRRQGKEAVAEGLEPDADLLFARKYIGGRYDAVVDGCRRTAHIDDVLRRDSDNLIVVKATVMVGKNRKYIEELWSRVQHQGCRL